MSSHTNLEGITGIVGLSTGIPQRSGPLFVKNLYNNGLIQDQVFGIKFGNESDSSFIDIGFFSWEAMIDPSQLVWFPVLADSFFW
jgi:hypothetical protein